MEKMFLWPDALTNQNEALSADFHLYFKNLVCRCGRFHTEKNSCGSLQGDLSQSQLSAVKSSFMSAGVVKTSQKRQLKVTCVCPQFMQRRLDAETKKQLEEDERRIISDEHWYLDLPELKAKEYV